MILNYKETENIITTEIAKKKKELDIIYKTLEEADEFGYTTTFSDKSWEDVIKTAINYGRKIGEYEGQIDALTTFLNYLYSIEYKNGETKEAK